MTGNPPACLGWLNAVLTIGELLATAQAGREGKARGLAAENRRLRTDLECRDAEVRLLRERLEGMKPATRPRYTPAAQAAILWHGARYGICLKELARRFVVGFATLRGWLRRLPKSPPRGEAPAKGRPLLPLVIEHLIHILRFENPCWGTRRIAQVLAKLGIRVSRSAVQRAVRRRPPKRPPGTKVDGTNGARRRRKRAGVKARRPDHVWLMDITRVNLLFGLVTVHIAAVLDAYTRAIVAIDLCAREPTAAWMCKLLDAAITVAGRAPRHLITDQGAQFTAKRFKRLARRRKIRRRFGAVGEHSSVALIERLWRTLKYEALPLWSGFLPPGELRRYVRRWASWYRLERVHQGIEGLTPAEMSHGRARRYRSAAELAGTEGWSLVRSFFEGDPGLPVYRLRKVA
ncbi:MAG: DDE-type integrase/transposase/recombinase [Planctomycetes bacterium]|nr:DDE-type integrase/transposase/recombinase [Planctomycetota bacterium]